MARDTKLKRDVALKGVARSFVSDPDRVGRCARPKCYITALNHPNIAAIDGLEYRALVMEPVDGPTLAERIVSGLSF